MGERVQRPAKDEAPASSDGDLSKTEPVVATWDIRMGNSDLDDNLIRLLAEKGVVRVKSEGITPLSRTCTSL